MRAAVQRVAAAITGAGVLPPGLNAALARLEKSRWPGTEQTWSRLTPSGFPVEFTIGEDDGTLRWTAEVAAPEVADAHRLLRAAALMADAGQAVPSDLLATLCSVQRNRDLRFGAWIGGRETVNDAGRLKLYAELPDDADLTHLRLPRALAEALAWPPLVGTRPRILGIEPARDRVELYVRLPAADPLDLLPFLHRVGHVTALDELAQLLPDGLRRLAGRRLGLSLAVPLHHEDPKAQLALFVSARTLFPGHPSQECTLVPSVSRLNRSCCRTALVSFGFGQEATGPLVRLGVVPAADREPGQKTERGVALQEA